MSEVNTASMVKTGGACALVGVACGLLGSAIGAVHALGGQEIAVSDSQELFRLVREQTPYVFREWLFLAYAIFVVGEGVGLYFLTRGAGSLALWALAVWFPGIIIGIVQDATLVAFVHQFPTDYAAADAATRATLEPLARMVVAMVGVQQSVANVLLGLGVALYSVAVLRTRVATRWFALLGLVAAAASVFYALVTVAAPRLDDLQPLAEQVFGFAVLWDLWAGLIMLRFRADRQRGDAHRTKTPLLSE